ncbi:MAG: hypothetical protein US18_C0013G0016 [Parcubacteria group bacterium GW2011_GWB1_36_5]|nr:MAG: hypothetical protein US12_C0003G0001 [Parcubacteria group bacterium GW2011_GWA2_36_24]KKQ07568.1 MAG: hypothetical protein US18_C0013G0016 [Parcubacteria group bacterium GW2011_GWB1_36_5]
MNTNIFERFSFWALFLVIVLLPLFFLPFTNIPIETSKGLLLVVGLAVCIICWGLARFFDGKISLPRSVSLLGGMGVVLAFFLSAFFSKTSPVSFFGTMFDVGTFWFILSGFLLMLMSSIILRDPKKAKIVLFGAILSGAVVLIFQIAHLLLPEILSLGILASKTDNILGSWNALGIFSGFSALLSLLVVEFFLTTKKEKLILQILTILSIIMIAIVNFPLVWELLGVSSLIIFVYKISLNFKRKAAESTENIEGAGREKIHFPAFSFAIIMITLLFFMSGDFIGGILPNRLGVQNTEISPTFSTTMGVTESVLKKNPIFGVGPNKFGETWAMYKPMVINATPFWDVSFNSGSGLLPTFASATGYFGILALLVFFVLFMMGGIKSIFSSIKNGVNWETMAFFVLALYLFVSSFFYSGGTVIFFLALAFAGVFIGLSSVNHPKGEILLSYSNDHRKSFFSILLIVFMLIITAAISFKYVERFVSISYFRGALTAATIPEAEISINKALSLYQNDLYLRTYAQIYLVKLDSLIAKDATKLSDEEKALLQSSLDQAIGGAESAIKYNPENYLNFQMLGFVYQKLTSFGVKDAYNKAIEAYTMALALNPLNPGLKLSLANVSIAGQKIKEAKDYANAALVLKPDYVDAYIILSQIAKSEGDNAEALSFAQKALSFSPTNADLIKYVDSMKNSNIPPVSPTITPTSTSTPKKP